MNRSWMLTFTLLLGFMEARAACAPDPGWLAKAPEVPPHHGAWTSLLADGNAIGEVSLGIGHVHPDEAMAFSDWLDRIVIPLSARPGFEPERLLVRGWLLDRSGGGEPLQLAGLIETEYEQNSMLVTGRQEDWFQLRLAPPGTPGETGWVARCALEASPVPLQFTPWKEWLLSDRISPLYFRRATAHRLRQGPGVQHGSVGMITGDHIIRPREVQGDWMRVEVTQPSDYCARVRATRRTGWIKWRSPERGPWVWYYPRGC